MRFGNIEEMIRKMNYAQNKEEGLVRGNQIMIMTSSLFQSGVYVPIQYVRAVLLYREMVKE